jgi:hypothetical protein
LPIVICNTPASGRSNFWRHVASGRLIVEVNAVEEAFADGNLEVYAVRKERDRHVIDTVGEPLLAIAAVPVREERAGT